MLHKLCHNSPAGRGCFDLCIPYIINLKFEEIKEPIDKYTAKAFTNTFLWMNWLK